MKKHFIIFLIIFALTIVVPVLVCLIADKQAGNRELIGIFNEAKSTTSALAPYTFDNFFKLYFNI